jgi:hypothetical protein
MNFFEISSVVSRPERAKFLRTHEKASGQYKWP